MPEMDDWSDGELVAAAGAGDEQAFAALWHRYADWVTGLSWRFCGDREIALEVLQETFSYLLRRLPTLELTASMKTFLYPVVRHLTRDERRRAGKVVTLAVLPEGVVPPQEPGSLREELARVMGGLPEGQREVVLLRFVDGLSLAEVGRALDIPVGTVKSRLHTALAALREDEGTRKYFAP